MEENKIIEIKNLKKFFGENLILENINLFVNKGEVVSIIGSSGSGKSTLLRSIINLETINDGEIFIEGVNIAEKNINKNLKKKLLLKMGMVFQSFNLFPHMTIAENIIKTLKIVKNIDEEEAGKIAKSTLSIVGLTEKFNSYPNELSGGQKQRAAIARTLAMKPDIILFDEPTSSLDPELVKEVLDIIKRLKDSKITMLIVSHEMNFVKEISDRIIFMASGNIIETGSPSDIFDNSKSERIKQFLQK